MKAEAFTPERAMDLWLALARCPDVKSSTSDTLGGVFYVLKRGAITMRLSTSSESRIFLPPRRVHRVTIARAKYDGVPSADLPNNYWNIMMTAFEKCQAKGFNEDALLAIEAELLLANPT